MKTYAALFLSLGLLVQGSGFAAETNASDNGTARKVLTSSLSREDSAGPAGNQPGMSSCKGNGDNCKALNEVKSCGAYVSSGKHHGYGFGGSKVAATSRALDMCGANNCQVVVAECED